ncbi:MAG TPA: DUF2339 domain-containing protein [Candidatus Acidoferrales bacterium]|nr:DUF2339 domain-containing protein [Candidatus Acidoferrales bacterium]
MDILLIIVFGVLLIYALRRLKNLEQQSDQLDSVLKTLRELESRIATLERPGAADSSRAAAEQPEAHAPAAPPSPPAQPVAEPFAQPRPLPPTPTTQLRDADFVPYTPPPETSPFDRIRGASAGFIRERVGSVEWEALVGGNLLNKLGILILIVGLSLFLGQLRAHLGPGGRIAVGVVVSLAMLSGGMFAEHRSRYVIVGRGLIGGGWAALYTTAYAAHGLPSSRIIESPTVATILLLAIAAGMIAHSIRYRAEAVTGVAYFVAFATLVLSPTTSFALFASVPLVASLLVVSHRFGWERMAVAGVVVTYASYAWGSRDSGAPAAFDAGQIALAIYWLMFEGFDLAALSRTHRREGSGSLLAPLNASGFIGVSILQWTQFRPADLFVLLAYSSVAFLASSVVRARIAPLSDADRARPFAERAAAGGYELSVSISSALAVAAIFQRYSGYSINVALLLEAQFLFLIGLQYGESYLQLLGALVFAIAAGKVGFVDSDDNRQILFKGLKFYAGTPAAILTAAAGYADRAIAMRSLGRNKWRSLAWISTIVASVVIAGEAEAQHTGLALLMLGGCLFEAGWFAADRDFRLQAYAVGALGVFSIAVVNLDLISIANSHRYVALGFGALIAYAISVQLMRLQRVGMSERERTFARDGASAGGTMLAAIALWHLAPPLAVAVAWIALAVVLVEAGFALPPLALRFEGYALAALAVARLFYLNFDATTTTHAFVVSDRVASVAPVIAAFYYLAWRVGAQVRSRGLSIYETAVAAGFLYGAAYLVMTLVWCEAAEPWIIDGWAVFGLLLLIGGVVFPLRDLRLQSYVAALAVFARCWTVNFTESGTASAIASLGPAVSTRISSVSIAIACLYASQLIAPRADAAPTAEPTVELENVVELIERYARQMLSLFATAMLTALFYLEVAGSLLTVAWALEAVALLTAGFALRERVLRLSGLLLFGVSILKVFAYDLRELEALPRIASFVVLGLMLIGVSFGYSRYREKLSRFL